MSIEDDIDSPQPCQTCDQVTMTRIQTGLNARDHDHIVAVGDCHMGICTAGGSVQTVCWEGGACSGPQVNALPLLGE